MANTESVTAQMTELLNEVNESIEQSAERNIQLVAKESVSKLKNSSPRKTGSYAKGWGVKRLGDKDVVVHNRTDYQLTHLLENGHVIRNKKGTYGRTRGIKHIAPVEEELVEEFQKELEKTL